MTTQPRTTTGDDDMRWVHEHMEEMRPYQGQWVAVSERRIIAAGSTIEQLVEAAEAQGVKSIFISRIPDDIDRKTYFIG